MSGTTQDTPTRTVFLRVTVPLSGMNFVNQGSRTLIATIGPLLAMEFSLSASELGLLAGMFFASYAAAQLPVGVAMDVFGVKRVQIVLGMVAGIGFALSAMATGPISLAIARMVTGLGVSVGMIAMLTAHSQWVSRDKVAAMTGAGVFMASFGGIAATLPAQQLLPLLGWRGMFWILAGIAFCVAVAIWLVVPDRERPPVRHRSLGNEIAEYGVIFRHPAFLRMAPAIVLLSGLGFTYGGLWAGPWLRDVGGFDDTTRAALLMAYMFGMMAGSLLAGQATMRLHRRGWGPMTVPVAALAGIFVAQAMLLWHPLRDAWFVGLLWFLFTFASAAGPAGYAAVAQRFPPEIAGRVGTSINFAMLVFTFVLQNVIGWILDLWPRTAGGGWDPAGYGWAWGVTLAFQAVAMLGLLPPGWTQRLKR